MSFFQQPFRPFFTFTALVAILVPMYFVGVIINGYYLSEDLLTVNLWHANEMIFGFTTALLTGFILTAAPKWANKSPISVAWTIILTLIWVITRVFFLYQPSVSILYVSSCSLLILVMYKIYLILKGNKNVVVILTLLSILLACQAAFIYGATAEDDFVIESVYKVVTFVVSAFLIIFSGKLIPFFVNSRLKTSLKQNMKFDLSIVATSLVTTIFSLTSLNSISALFSFICFVLLSIRIKRLYLKEVFSIPLLWILFIGHIWLNLYFILNLFSMYFEFLDQGRAVFHALFAGALGTFAIGMMSRVSLGHSGLEMRANTTIKAAFYSMILGSVLRVFHPIFLDGVDGIFLHISMGFWTLSYILFLINFLPKFLKSKG